MSAMSIEQQETISLPVLRLEHPPGETAQQRYQRLKAFLDATGVRLLLVYLFDERQRVREARSSHKSVKSIPGSGDDPNW